MLRTLSRQWGSADCYRLPVCRQLTKLSQHTGDGDFGSCSCAAITLPLRFRPRLSQRILWSCPNAVSSTHLSYLHILTIFMESYNDVPSNIRIRLTLPPFDQPMTGWLEYTLRLRLSTVSDITYRRIEPQAWDDLKETTRAGIAVSGFGKNHCNWSRTFQWSFQCHHVTL